jgi:hypothetical protein
MKKYLIYTLIIIIVSCTKSEVSIVKKIDLPVVEAYLIAGGPIKVTVSLPVALNQDVATPVFIDTLHVRVYVNGQLHQLNSIGNGAYLDNSTKVAVGSDYKLEFYYNNLKVTSETIVPPNPQNLVVSTNTIAIPQFGSGFAGGGAAFPSPLILTWDNTNQDFYFVASKCFEPILVSINSDTTQNRPVFSRPPSQENTASLRFNSFSYYGLHHVYLYRANPEYVALFKSSGTNSQNITNPITNIQNGFGIFTSFGVDSVIVTVTH